MNKEKNHKQNLQLISFKVFLEFVTVLLLFFTLWFFGLESCGILAPQTGIEPAAPALESEVLITGLPGKSLEEATLIPAA